MSKRGTLYIDDRAYEATDEMLEYFDRVMHRNDYGNWTEQYEGRLRNGETVHYYSDSNTVDKPADVDSDGKNPYVAGIPVWKQRLHATVNSKRNKYQTWLHGLSGFNYSPKTDAEDSTSSTPIGAENLSFKYKVNEDGSKTYLTNDADNLAIQKRISDLRGWYGADEDGRKKYNMTAWGTPGTDKIINLFKTYDALDENNNVILDNKLAEIDARARKSELTDDDWSFLANLNIVPTSDQATLQAEADAETKRKLDALRGTWTTAGYGDYFDPLHDYYDLDGDSLKLKAGVSSPYANLRNMYFNDDYYKTPEAATGEYDALKGLTFYNGRFYNINSPTLAKIVNSENGFNAQRRAGNWNAAENIIATMHTTDPLGAPAGMPANRYSSFFAKNPRYFYSPNTGYQWLADPTNVYDANGNRITVDDTMQVVRYYDMNSPTSDGPYTTYANKYALLDEHGNFIADLDGSAVINLEETDPRYNKERGFGAYERVVSDNPYFNGRYIVDLIADDGKGGGISFYYSPTDSNDVLMHIQNFAKRTFVGGFAKHNGYDNVAIKIPQVLMEAFANNPDLWKILENAPQKDDFENVMSLIFTSTSANRGTGSIQRKLKRLGFSSEDIHNIMEWVRTTNRQERMRYIIPNVPPREATIAAREAVIPEKVPEETEETESLKNGGVLKFRYGGSNEQKPVSAKSYGAKSYESTKNASNLLDGKIIQSQGDTAELVAVLADLGSLATAMAGITPAAAGLGAAGSTARFTADMQRGEKGAGGRYLLDLGMDAATLIPGLGILAKLGKVKRYAPFLLRVAAGAGVGSAVYNSINQLANGRLTLRDIDIIVNGLSGAAGLRRMGLKNGVAKTTKIEEVEIKGKTPVRNQSDITVKGKDGTADVILTKDDLANVTNENDLMKALQAKTKTNGVELTSAQVKEKFDFETAKGQLVPEGKAPNKITLTEAELKGAKSQEDLEKIFLRKAKEADSSITDLASAKAKYDFDAVLEKGSRWHPGWSPKNWFRTTEKTSWKPSSTTEAVAIPASENNFKNWRNGAGLRQQAYRDRINGENTFTKGPKEVKAPKDLETQVVKPGDAPDDTKLWSREDLVQPDYVKRVEGYNPEVDNPAKSATKGPEDFEESTVNGVRKTSQSQYAEYLADLRRRQALSEQFEKRAKWEAYRKEKTKTKAHNKDLNDAYTSQQKKFNEYQKDNAAWQENKRKYDQYRKQWFMFRPFVWGGLDSNRGNYEIDDSYVAYNPYRTYNPMVAYDKKGGKIKKLYFGGFPGIQFNGDSLAASVSATNAASNNWLQGYKNQIASFGKTPSYLDNLGKMEYTWGTDANNKVTITPTFKSPTPTWKQNFWYAKPGTAVTNNKDGKDKPINLSGGNNERAFDINKAGIALGNTIGEISSGNASLKQLDVTTGVPPLMQKGVTYPVPPIVSNGVGEAYFNAAKEIGNVKDTSSNAITNNIQHQTRDESREKLNLSGNLEVSKNLSTILDKQYSTALKQATANTDTFNKNAESWFVKRTNDAAQKAAHYAQLQSIKNNALIGNLKLFDEWSSNFIKDRNAPTYQEELLSLTNDYKAKLNGLSANSPEAVLLMDQFKIDRDELARKYRMSEASYKKGGKVSKMSYAKDITADLLLQSNKDTQAFLRKLSDTTQRLLLQIAKK